MSDIVVQVDNLSKVYRIGLKEDLPDTFAGAVASWLKAPARNFRRLRRLNTFTGTEPVDSDDVVVALRQVSFQVRDGEVLGIVGRNGAGKSTLLKILSRITEPTFGRVAICGRVSSLLEVGTGFHPEMTGRENVYLNGTILGMKKREIDEKFDEMVEFSGIEKFLDTPVKWYSSGMKVRLAFAVAAHLEPDILIIDEVLAVGDAQFQGKCLGKMGQVAGSGRTVLFVSHQLGVVKSLCTRAILLDNGAIRRHGPVGDVLDEYVKSFSESATLPLRDRTDRRGSGAFRFTNVRFLDSVGNSVSALASGECLSISIAYETVEAIDEKTFTFLASLWDPFGVLVAMFSSQEMGPAFRPFDREGELTIHIPRMTLRGGNYRLKLWASQRDTALANLYDCIEDAATIQILAGDFWRTGNANRVGSYCVIEASMQN